MTKYLFNLLFVALLILGFYYGSDENSQSPQSNTATEVEDIYSCANTGNCTCMLVSGQTHKDYQTFGNGTSNYSISDGVLGDFSSFRSTPPPNKILKTNAVAMRQMLHFLNAQLPENKWQGLSPDTNYIKYSNKYYVYTLAHILI